MAAVITARLVNVIQELVCFIKPKKIPSWFFIFFFKIKLCIILLTLSDKLGVRRCFFNPCVKIKDLAWSILNLGPHNCSFRLNNCSMGQITSKVNHSRTLVKLAQPSPQTAAAASRLEGGWGRDPPLELTLCQSPNWHSIAWHIVYVYYICTSNILVIQMK